MKRALFNCLMAGLALMVFHGCKSDSVQRHFRELDKAIAQSSVYWVAFESRMDSLRREFANAPSDSIRWERAFELYSGYSLVNNDSTLLWLHRMNDCSYGSQGQRLLTRVCGSEMYSLTGDKSRFEGSIPLLPDTEVPPEIESRYYTIIVDSYSNFPYQDSNKDIDLLEKAIGIQTVSNDIQLYYKGLREMAYNDYETALGYLQEAMDLSSEPYRKACIANSIAHIYHQWDLRDMEEKYLTLASVQQIRTPAVLPSSLQDLSVMLFEDGDLERASRYSRFVLSRAVDSPFTNTVISSVKAQMSLMDSLEAKEKSRTRMITVALAILLGAVIITTGLWRSSIKKSRALQQSREQLKSSNDRLLEADRVKEGVMFKYMLSSIGYLQQANENRRQYHKTLREEGEDALKKVLRDPSPFDKEYKQFYKEFDDAFLGVYPDFIARINELFPPEYRFKDTGSMNNQLRILAAIKLGLTDSGQIANFLNLSPTSVYTHRSRMKHQALCDSEEFENIIQSI